MKKISVFAGANALFAESLRALEKRAKPNSMIFNYTDYRSYLRDHLSSQISKNPSYSLRALARKLEMAPSSLSEILNGKKKISHAMARKISLNLNLSHKESEYFSLLADLEMAGDEESKLLVSDRLRKLSRKSEAVSLDLELFRVISDWYHIPIIEMTRIPNFNFTPQKIAERLGIRPLDARSAIERLEKLELIEKNKDGKYIKVTENNLFSSNVKNEALRKFYRQMLEQASKALESQTPEQRFSGSETFAVDENLHSQAREILNDAFDKIVALAADSKKPKNVYHLSIHYFSLTKGETK